LPIIVYPEPSIISQPELLALPQKEVSQGSIAEMTTISTAFLIAFVLPLAFFANLWQKKRRKE